MSKRCDFVKKLLNFVRSTQLFSTNLELTDKIENLRKKYLINISIASLIASIPFKIFRIGDFFNEVVMFNSKVIPKKLVDKGFVFKFESLKKIMTF